MKSPTLMAIVILLSLTQVSLAQSAPAAKPTPENSYTDVIDEESLASMIEKSEEAKKIYEQCTSDPNAGPLDECLRTSWDALSTEDKAKISQALQSKRVTFEDGKQVFKEDKIDLLKVNPSSVEISNSNDPAVKKLRKYLADQLSEALYGEVNKTSGQFTHKRLVDHSTFYELFESQVGQNIILALSDYCLKSNEVQVEKPDGVDPDGSIKVKDGSSTKTVSTITVYVPVVDTALRTTTLEANMNALKGGFMGSGGADDQNSDFSKQRKRYTMCISRINLVCKPPKDSWTDQREREERNGGFTRETPIKEDQSREACLVTEYLDRGRQALIDLEKIKKTMASSKGNSGFSIDGAKDSLYQNGRGKDEKSIQELTIHTSKEIQASGMEEEAAKVAEKIDECINAGGSEDECKNFLDTDLEAKQEVLANEFFRVKAQEVRLEEKLKEDEQAVLTYLKEEGYDETAAQEIVDEAGGSEEAIKKIMERYKMQKDAVIYALNKEIEKSTVSENDSAQGKIRKAEALKASIEARPKQLAELLQFSNLASSFIEVHAKGGDGEVTKSANSLAAFTELAGFDGSQRAPSDNSSGGTSVGLFDSQDDVNKALEKLQGKEGNTSGDDSKNATLSVEQINENLLDY